MERKSVGFEQLSTSSDFVSLMNDSKPATARSAWCTPHGRWWPGRFKDYISHRKQNDYRSIHTTVSVPAISASNCRIRTDEMGPDRGIGHRGARLLQGRRRFSDRALEAGIQTPSRWLAPHHRHFIGKRPIRRVFGAYQARAVSRPVFCFTPKGKLIAAAAPGQCDRFCLCRAHRCSATVRLDARSTASSRRCRPNCRMATRSRWLTSEAQSAAAFAWSRSRSPARHGRRSGVRRAPRSAVQYAVLAAASWSGCSHAQKSNYADGQVEGRAARLARASIDDVMARRPRRDEGLRRRARDVSRLQEERVAHTAPRKASRSS